MFNKRSPPIVRLQAARDLLDRAGLSPKSIVEVEVGIDPEVLAMIHAAREEERAGHARRALEAGAVVAGDGMDGVIDAGLAEDDDPGGWVDLALEAVES